MSKHTPAPWHINKTFKTEFEIWTNGTPKIALVPDTHVSINEQAANANLIAAAPDLLLALEMFVEQYQGNGNDGRENRPEFIAARASIAKAKGI